MAIARADNIATAEQIAAFEGEIGVFLPSEYVDFLLEFNGGAPTPDVVDIVGLPGSPTDVQMFFGLNRSVETSDLRWNLDLIGRSHAAEAFVPIACDSGGGLFCFRVVQRRATDVVYLQIDGEPTMYFVAPDFGSFINALREFD